jgi:Skp family chaperone for outer membrane proteins
MNPMKKRLLCTLLALILCLSMLPRAAADEIGYALYPEVNYGYSQNVKRCSIRYVSQLVSFLYRTYEA